MKKIIIRTPNFIGDTINTTPCLELIKQEYPEAEFTIVGPDFVRELFKYDPRITHYITFPLKRKKKLSTYWKIVRELRKENGELGVIFVNTFISALLFRLGNVKKNIGYNREGRGFLLDFSPEKKLSTYWKIVRELRKENGELGVIFVNTFISALLFRLGNVKKNIGYNREGRGFLLDFSPEINYHKHYINRYAFLFNEYIGNKYVYLPELSLRYTGQKTFQFDNSHKTIALYLGGENKEFRKYPDEYAVQLLRLLNRQGYNLLLIGDENDNIKHTQYAEEARIDHLINLTARTTIEGFINTIANVDLIITIDSSALHIAAAVKTPFIALMGLSTSPTSTILPKVPLGRILKIENNLIREEDYIRNITPDLILKTISELI